MCQHLLRMNWLEKLSEKCILDLLCLITLYFLFPGTSPNRPHVSLSTYSLALHQDTATPASHSSDQPPNDHHHQPTTTHLLRPRIADDQPQDWRHHKKPLPSGVFPSVVRDARPPTKNTAAATTRQVISPNSSRAYTNGANIRHAPLASVGGRTSVLGESAKQKSHYAATFGDKRTAHRHTADGPPLIRHRRHTMQASALDTASRDGGTPTTSTDQPQQQQLSDVRHRHAVVDAPTIDDTQIDRPITQDLQLVPVKPHSTAALEHAFGLVRPRTQSRQQLQPALAVQPHNNNPNTTHSVAASYRQLLGPDTDTDFTSQPPPPPSLDHPSHASSPSSATPSITDHKSNIDEDIVIIDDNDDVDDDIADEMELNAIQRSTHSNEQIIILSNGDSSGRVHHAVAASGDASSSAATMSSSPYLGATIKIKPTMRRRSAAAAADPAPAKGTASLNVRRQQQQRQPPLAQLSGFPLPSSSSSNPPSGGAKSAAAAPSTASAAVPAVVGDDDPPKALPLRPIVRGPYEDDEDADNHQGEMTVVYAEPHTEIKLNCDVDLDIVSTVWLKDGQVSAAQYI